MTPKEKDPAAVSLGRRGGAKKRPGKGFAALPPEERIRRAKAAVAKRWEKKK